MMMFQYYLAVQRCLMQISTISWFDWSSYGVLG